jgi:hypothetical protein
MTTYTIIKSPRSGYLIDDGSDHCMSIRYATKCEAEKTIASWESSARFAKEYAAEVRTARLEAVKAYLAVRAERRAEAAKQLAFAF